MQIGDYILILESYFITVRPGDVCLVTKVYRDNHGVSATKTAGYLSLYHETKAYTKITLTPLEEVIYGLKTN